MNVPEGCPTAADIRHINEQYRRRALSCQLIEARDMLRNLGLSKYTRQAYLNLIRDLEKQLGIESQPYNSPCFSRSVSELARQDAERIDVV